MSNVTTPPEAAVDSKSAGLTLPAFRLNLMRGGYLLMAIGTFVVKGPLLPHVSSLPAIEGATVCILIALALLAFLGVRYPIGMLPILMFEVLWKVLWLGAGRGAAPDRERPERGRPRACCSASSSWSPSSL